MGKLPALDVSKKVNHSPHIVILGAGSSRASCPNGDRNGLVLPLMDEHFAAQIGLVDFLSENKIDFEGIGFESLYTNLVNDGFDNLSEIDNLIRQYFSKLKLPEKVTIYDKLVLSLREKDLIASFNWDPFLMEAIYRNRNVQKLPKVVFLHGNVSVGICEKDKIKGYIGNPCSVCGEPLAPVPLLYPVEHKDYESNIFISNEWAELKEHLKHAYLISIFGYAAPESDVAAKKLMMDVWQSNETRELAQVEIIDVKDKEDLLKTWGPFITDHHYSICRSFEDSYITFHPRRTCDAYAFATLQCDPWRENRIPNFDNLIELHSWLKQLLLEEGEKGSKFSGHPVLMNTDER